MGLKPDKIRKKLSRLLRLTQWNSLIICPEEAKPGQRIVLPRKKSVLLGYQDKLLFILVYLKAFPLHELQSAPYSLTQPHASGWIHLLGLLIRKTLKRMKKLPEQNNREQELLLKPCPDVLLDVVERLIQRPLDIEQQQDYYSGKKKHSLKNNILFLPDLQVMYLSPTYAGNVHDKRFCDHQPQHLPRG